MTSGDLGSDKTVTYLLYFWAPDRYDFEPRLIEDPHVYADRLFENPYPLTIYEPSYFSGLCECIVLLSDVESESESGRQFKTPGPRIKWST